MLVTDNFLVNGFSIGFSLLNDFTCKIYKYTAHLTATVSKFSLIYILIERYLAIKYPVESNYLRKQSFQLVYQILVTVIGCIYYTPVLVFFKIQNQTSSDNSTNAAAAAVSFCDPIPDKKLTMQLLSFVNEVAIPAVLIVIFSIVLIFKIIKLKSHVSTFFTPRENEIFKKDVHLSIMAIVMSFLFIIAFLPLIIIGYSGQNMSIHIFLACRYFYLLIRTFKLYFFLTFSSLFREAFVSLFQQLRQKPHHTKANEEIEML